MVAVDGIGQSSIIAQLGGDLLDERLRVRRASLGLYRGASQL